LRLVPLAVLATVIVSSAAALAALAFSGAPGLAAEVDGAAVAVCGFAWTAAVFLLPRLRGRIKESGAGRVNALPVAVPTGSLPEIVRGRDPEMTLLWQLLRRPDNRFVVLAGMGGVGKSTIATAFGEHAKGARAWRRHTDVWFVTASDPASLASGLASVARQLEASPADVKAIGTGRSDAPDRLWPLLEHAPRRWLLIFDNADDPSVLARPQPAATSPVAGHDADYGKPGDGTGWLRPTRRGLVVVTSRADGRSRWGNHARIVPVGPLNDVDAAQVLLDGAPDAGDRAQARALARRLGGLPLALRTAGSYLASDSASVRSFHDYETELDHQRETPQLLAQAPELQTPAIARGIPFRTFELTLNDLDRQGVPQARPLLRLLSCYASPVPIPRALLQAGEMRGILGGGTDARHVLEHGLQQLKDRSLIEFRAQGTGTGPRDVVLHPVIAAATRAHLRSDDDPLTDAALVRHTSVDLLGGVLRGLDVHAPADWPVFVAYGPHVHALFETVADQVDDQHLQALLATTPMTALAHLSYGASTEGWRLARMALDRLALLPEDPGSLNTRHYLAWFLAALGETEEAEAVYRNVLAAREHALGPDHRDTLTTRHELAWVAACGGRWPEAESAYRVVAEARRAALGHEDPETLTTLHELGWAIANQGRGREAEQMLTQVLQTRRRVLGNGHPRTLWTWHELAWAMAIQGRWAEAEAIYHEVLGKRREVLVASHPDILTTKYELAWTIASQGRHEAALELLGEVLDARRTVLGDDDPETIATAQAMERLRQGEIVIPRHLA
jgi:tetratricopeptide (TPR) repeat protein